MPAYKDEKRGTWYVRFRYTDWTGKRVETTKRGFATKRDAKEYEEAAKREKTAAAGMTFGELYKIYVEDMRPRLRKTTMQGKEAVIEKHILPYFKDTPLEEITPVTIRKWQSEIMKQESYLTKAKFSNRYKQFIQVNFSAILTYGVKYYGMQQNPIKIAGTMGKLEPKEMDYWTPEEFSTFLSYETKPMYRAIFLILYWCGLRRGEVLALNGEDIDEDAKTIRINKSYTRLNGQEDSIDLPKTAKSVRTITAPSAVISAVQEYKQNLYSYDAKKRLFPIFIHGIRERIKKLCAISGVKKIRVHDLRHSHASYLINNNVPIKIVSERLGHESVETTLKVYAHIYKDTESTVLDMIESDALKFCGQNAVKQK